MIKNRKEVIIAMIITAILWSLGGMLIKMVSGHSLAIASGRAGIAAIVMMIYCRFKFERISRKLFMSIILYSFTVIGFVVANKLTTAANAIFLQFTAPIWVALFSRLFLKVRIRYSDIISIIILIGGLFVFLLEKVEEGMFIGNVIAFLTGISFAGFIVSLKSIEKGKTIYPILYGNILTFVIGLPFYTNDLYNFDSLKGLLLLGLIQVGLSYILYSKAIEYISALDAILIPVIEPLLNPLWVSLTIGEIPSVFSLIGGIIIILTMLIRSIYQTNIVKGY